jgi:hypothetical protein
VAGLRQSFSEYGLIRFRVLVECRWLQKLSQLKGVRCTWGAWGQGYELGQQLPGSQAGMQAGTWACRSIATLLMPLAWPGHLSLLACHLPARCCCCCCCSEVPPFGPAATAVLDQLATGFTVTDALEVRAGVGLGRKAASDARCRLVLLCVPCKRMLGLGCLMHCGAAL